MKELFALFDVYMQEHGYLAMGGQIVDATIVPAPRQCNWRDDNEVPTSHPVVPTVVPNGGWSAKCGLTKEILVFLARNAPSPPPLMHGRQHRRTPVLLTARK